MRYQEHSMDTKSYSVLWDNFGHENNLKLRYNFPSNITVTMNHEK